MESKRRLGLIGIALIVCAVIATIPAMAEARTIQVVNLLLQNLHDVFINNPITGQVLTYNGTYWINQNATGGGESTQCINMASQYQIIVNSTAGNCYVRSLANGDNIILSQNSTHIIINATGTESTVCSNSAVSGQTLISSSTGGNCVFKKLRSGNGISLSSNSTHITITNSLPEATACNNVGSGNQLCSGGNVNIDTLIAGNGITITDTTDDWTFASQCNNTGSGEAICESSNNINSLIATSPLSVTDTTGDLTIACSTCITSSTFNWVLLDTQSPSDGATTFTTDTFTGHKFNVMHVYLKGNTAGSTAGDIGMRFSGNTNTDYNNRCSLNLAAQVTAGSQTSMQLQDSADELFEYAIDVYSYTTPDGSWVTTNSVGSVNAPDAIPTSFQCYFNVDNIASITSVTIFRVAGTWTFDQTSVINVYGHD